MLTQRSFCYWEESGLLELFLKRPDIQTTILEALGLILRLPTPPLELVLACPVMVFECLSPD